MLRLLVKVALLTALPAALVLSVAPARALESVRAISPLRYQVYRVAAIADSVVSVALGDSHAALGFRSPDSAAYSLAFPGENLAEIVMKTRQVAETLPRLRSAFLQAQPHMFYTHRTGGPRDEYLALFGGGSRTRTLPTPLRLMLDPCCRGEIPGVALKSFLGIPVAMPIPEISPTGYSLYPDSLRFRGILTADANREVASYGGIVPNGELRHRFGGLVAELRARGIDVVLTRYPLSPEYRTALGAEAFADADRFFTSLEGSHGARSCGAWDLYEDRSLFFNSDHLTAGGASRYWRDVVSRCLATNGRAPESSQAFD